MTFQRQPSPCIFLDRDGVINVDTGYPYRKDDLTLIDGVGEAIAKMNKLNFLVVVVTNQSGIARGFFTEHNVHQFHQYIQDALKPYHAYINAFYLCPYHPKSTISQYKYDNHPDRKPNPGMIERAIIDLSIDRSQSFLIGDKQSDVDAAHRANIDGYLFNEQNLNHFLSKILKERSL